MGAQHPSTRLVVHLVDVIVLLKQYIVCIKRSAFMPFSNAHMKRHFSG